MRRSYLLLPLILLAIVPAKADEPSVITKPADPQPIITEDSSDILHKAGRLGTQALAPFMLAGALGVAGSGDYQSQRLGRSAEGVIATGALTEALKKLVHERRPNGENYESFPSGHASLAFSTATIIDAYQPHYKGLGYAAATWIGVSRVIVHAHHWHDVLAGAALGHFVTRAFTGKYRGDDEDNSPANLPAAVPGQFSLASSLNQTDQWKLRLDAGRLAVVKSW